MTVISARAEYEAQRETLEEARTIFALHRAEGYSEEVAVAYAFADYVNREQVRRFAAAELLTDFYAPIGR